MIWLISLIFFLAASSEGWASAEEGVTAGGSVTSQSAAPTARRKTISMPPIATELALIFTLQDKAAEGELQALASLKQVLVHAGPAVSAFMTSASDDEIRLVAPLVVAYVLSGGDPRTAATLSTKTAIDMRYRQLLEGSALFMQGNPAEAAKIFSDVQRDQLPARMLGRVALVQALLEKDNPTVKQNLLAAAMAAMPGSLIEESALRRSALAFAESDDEAQFWERLGRYQRRFPHSLFAGAFWDEISGAIVKWAARKPSLALDRLDLIWSDGDVSSRRRHYLGLARQAAALNERRVTEFAAARLHRLAVANSAEDQFARLYMAIYRITSPEGDDALRQLKSLHWDLLGEQEQVLLAAALRVNAQIRRPLPMSTKEKKDQPEEDPLNGDAQDALAASDKLLGSIGK